MIYFTSDLHLHHPYIAALRGFIDQSLLEPFNGDVAAFRQHCRENNDSFWKYVDVVAHDQMVINNINGVVSEDDMLFVLGDVSSSTKSAILKSCADIVEKVNVPWEHRFLVLGNHDMISTNGVTDALEKVFYRCQDHIKLTPDDSECLPVVCYHYPPFEYLDQAPMWMRPKQKVFDGAGHATEGTLYLHGHTHSYDCFDAGLPNTYNVGLEANDLKPISLNEILEKVEKHNKELEEQSDC